MVIQTWLGWNSTSFTIHKLRRSSSDNQEFLKNTFVVINSDGDEYILKTVGKSIYITMRIGYRCYFVWITRKVVFTDLEAKTINE